MNEKCFLPIKIVDLIKKNGHVTKEQLRESDYSQEFVDMLVKEKMLKKLTDGSYYFDLGASFKIYGYSLELKNRRKFSASLEYMELAHQINPINDKIRMSLLLSRFMEGKSGQVYEYYDELVNRHKNFSKTDNFLLFILFELFPNERYRSYVNGLLMNDMLPFMEGSTSVQEKIVKALFERKNIKAKMLYTQNCPQEDLSCSELAVKSFLTSLAFFESIKWRNIFDLLTKNDFDGIIAELDKTDDTEPISFYEKRVYELALFYNKLSFLETIGDTEELTRILNPITICEINKEYNTFKKKQKFLSRIDVKILYLTLAKVVQKVNYLTGKRIEPEQETSQENIQEIDAIIDRSLPMLNEIGTVFIESKSKSFFTAVKNRLKEREIASCMLIFDFKPVCIALKPLPKEKNKTAAEYYKTRIILSFERREHLEVIENAKKYFMAGGNYSPKLLFALGRSYLALDNLYAAKYYLMIATSLNNKKDRVSAYDCTQLIEKIDTLIQLYNEDEEYDICDKYYGIKYAKEIVENEDTNKSLVSTLRALQIPQDHTCIIKLLLAKKYAESGNNTLRDHYLKLASITYPRSHFAEDLYRKTLLETRALDEMKTDSAISF